MPNVQPQEWGVLVAAIGLYVLVPAVLAWLDARRVRQAASEAAETAPAAPVTAAPAAVGVSVSESAPFRAAVPAAGDTAGAAVGPAIPAGPAAVPAEGGVASGPPGGSPEEVGAASATPVAATSAAPGTPASWTPPGPRALAAGAAATPAGQERIGEIPGPVAPPVPMPYAFRLQELRLVRMDDVPPPAGFDAERWLADRDEGRRRFDRQRRRIETLALRAPFPPQAFAYAGAEIADAETARLCLLLFPGLWPSEPGEAGALVEVTLRGDTILGETVRPLPGGGWQT